MNQSDMSQIIQTNDSSFGMVYRFPERKLCELKFTPITCFCNDSSLSFICSLIDDAIYDFFLGWWILFFQSLIKSTLLAGKDLLCLDDKQHNNGRWQIQNFSSPVKLDVSQVSTASSARIPETSSRTVEEKSCVCARYVLVTISLEYTSED